MSHPGKMALAGGPACRRGMLTSSLCRNPHPRVFGTPPLQAQPITSSAGSRGVRAAASSAAGPDDGLLSSSNTSSSDGAPSGSSAYSSMDSMEEPLSSSNFCIIESRDAVKDFEQLAVGDLRNNLTARRNRIFLLMEEVRRLRIQLRVKGGDINRVQEIEQERFMSALPFMPQLSQESLNTYYAAYSILFSVIVLFGGLLSPMLEVKLGLGGTWWGTSYLEFVQRVGLPTQLADVDPIVASFCGGSVGVLSALLAVEVNNINKQTAARCHYCEGTGYLSCGQCIGSGVDPEVPAMAAASSSGSGGTGRSSGPISMVGGVPTAARSGMAARSCSCCSGTGKVMCTGCLCTGKQLATEHDPRIDPFQ